MGALPSHRGQSSFARSARLKSWLQAVQRASVVCMSRSSASSLYLNTLATRAWWRLRDGGRGLRVGHVRQGRGDSWQPYSTSG